MVAAKKSKAKKEELIVLDENILMIAKSLLERITNINIPIDSHVNKKTVIIDEKALNDYIGINVRLSGLKEVKKVYISILDNDTLEIDLDIQKFEGDLKLKKKIKISDASLTNTLSLFKYNYDDIYDHKGNSQIEKIIAIFTKYLVKQSFTDDIFKKFTNEKVKASHESIEMDLKEDYLSFIYTKTVNEVLITTVPFFGNKKITDLFSIESIMCEKGQIWIDYVFKIS